MKHLSLLVVAVFIFAGCTQKQVVVKPTPQKPVVKPVEPKKVEEVKEVVEVEEEPHQEKVVEVVDDGLNKIAILYPSKVVGKYAKSTISTVSAYLIHNNQTFNMQTFDTYDENPENIINQVLKLQEQGFVKVIALFTQKGFETMNSIDESSTMRVYFPLINKQEIFAAKDNFIFGGISYQEQIDLLRTISSEKNSMFYVKSYIGNKLRDYYLNSFDPSSTIKEVQRKRNNYKSLVEDSRVMGSTVLLNTPIIKSAIIMSQLTAFEAKPYKILSTQLNYNPLLVTLTQARDRNNFFVVSSIAQVDEFLEEYTDVLGADVSYNWVDYSSLVGVNYLLKDNDSASVTTQVIDNQAIYEPTLYKSTSYGFQKVLSN